MRFTCNREQLVQAIATVERVVPTRDVNDALKESILIEAEAGQLRLTAFDLEVGIECVADADVTQEGARVVNARLFGQLVRKLAGTEVEFVFEQGDGTAAVRSGRANFSIHTRSAADYPALPEVQGGTHWTVEQGVMRQMIRQTVFAAASDDHRSYLNGILFEAEDDTLSLVTTDTNRLAYRKGLLAAPVEQPGRAIVPTGAAQELARVLDADDETALDVILADNKITFALPGVRIVSRLLEGQFPNYRQVLPQEQPITITADRAELSAAVERAAVLARKGPAVVIIDVQDGVLTLSARETDVGHSNEQLDVEQTGENGHNSYQARFILDVLRATESDKVQMAFDSGDAPATLGPDDSEDYLCLVMPVRLR